MRGNLGNCCDWTENASRGEKRSSPLYRSLDAKWREFEGDSLWHLFAVSEVFSRACVSAACPLCVKLSASSRVKQEP